MKRTKNYNINNTNIQYNSYQFNRPLPFDDNNSNQINYHIKDCIFYYPDKDGSCYWRCLSIALFVKSKEHKNVRKIVYDILKRLDRKQFVKFSSLKLIILMIYY